MLHDFKRKYPLYAMPGPLPSPDDCVEWLAIMQHYGCPTRMLDFSDSLFIAAYFAIVDSKEEAAIWAVDWIQIRDHIHGLHQLKYERGRALLDEVNAEHIRFSNCHIAQEFTGLEDRWPKCVLPVRPKCFNLRLMKQQGLFLIPTNSHSTFRDNLDAAFPAAQDATLNWNSKQFMAHAAAGLEAQPFNIVKLRLPEKLHRDGRKLLQMMNLNAETLFSGVDGMARSLAQLHVR